MARKRIGELLIEQKAITVGQLHEALQYQRDHGGRIGVALISTGALTEEGLVEVLGRSLGIPLAQIPAQVDPDALKLVKRQFAEEHLVIPLAVDGTNHASRRVLKLAVADPLDLRTIEEIEFVTGCRIQLAIATPGLIRMGILRHYHKQNIDLGRGGMVIVRPGGVEQRLESSSPPPPPRSSGTLPGEEEILSLTDEVTSRTEAAEFIREMERRQPNNAHDANLKFLTGDTDAERVERLEKKFWALVRLLAAKGIITKEEFLAELDLG